jgi:pentatricopeptide repeat protein
MKHEKVNTKGAGGVAKKSVFSSKPHHQQPAHKKPFNNHRDNRTFNKSTFKKSNEANPSNEDERHSTASPPNQQQEMAGDGEEIEAETKLDIDRVKQVQLNQKISQHASRKELQQAHTLYEEALKEELANSHTFGAMVNAAVRCGDMAMAESVISTMLSKGRKLKDVVLYTTLMKGYCAQGNLTKALTLYQDLLKKKAVVQPNIRTINTLLRGCVQTGETFIAETLLQQMQRDLKLKPDVSSWEYLVALLSQSLLVDKIPPIVGRVKSEAHLRNGLPSMLVHLARSAALSGDFKLAKKTLQQARSVLEEEIAVAVASEGLVEVTELDLEGTENMPAITNKNKDVMGGKRAWKSQGDTTLSTDQRRNQSLLLYREHIREEWKQEIQLLSQFIETRQRALTLSSTSPSQDALDFLTPYFFRMMSFDSNMNYGAMDSTVSIFTATGAYNTISAQDLRRQIFVSLCYKFGLDALMKKCTGYYCAELIAAGNDTASIKDIKDKKQKSSKSSSSVSSLLTSLVEMINSPPSNLSGVAINPVENAKAITFAQGLYQAVNSYFDDDGKLRFDMIFRQDSTSTDLITKPIKLEVCSGAGEWGVTQVSGCFVLNVYMISNFPIIRS